MQAVARPRDGGIPVDGGRGTAASIPGAMLMEVPGMGHDLPAALIGRRTDAVAAHAHRAAVSA